MIVEPETCRPERFFDLVHVWVQEEARPLSAVKLLVTEVRLHKDRILVGLEGCASINDAESYRDSVLLVDEDEVIELEEDEFFFHDLIDCEVYLPDGTVLGVVADIMVNSAQEILVVRSGEREWLIPFVEEFIEKIDLTTKQIHITPIEGLLEDED